MRFATEVQTKDGTGYFISRVLVIIPIDKELKPIMIRYADNEQTYSITFSSLRGNTHHGKRPSWETHDGLLILGNCSLSALTPLSAFQLPSKLRNLMRKGGKEVVKWGTPGLPPSQKPSPPLLAKLMGERNWKRVGVENWQTQFVRGGGKNCGPNINVRSIVRRSIAMIDYLFS